VLIALEGEDTQTIFAFHDEGVHLASIDRTERAFGISQAGAKIGDHR
jgi:hypothetical protein